MSKVQRPTPLRPKPLRPKPDWKRGREAFRKLMEDPDRTEHAFEVNDAVDPDRELRVLERLRKTAEGRDLLARKPALVEPLSDRAALERLPEDSFGRAYLAFTERHGLDPAGLIRLRRSYSASQGNAAPQFDEPDFEWMRDRILLMHDLWHVLTGYDADPLGEAVLLPFSWAQIGGRANRLLSLRVFRRLGNNETRARMLRSGWRGLRARWLSALPYEDLLAKPLEEVRELARL